MTTPSFIVTELLEATYRGSAIVGLLLVLRWAFRKHVPAWVVSSGWLVAASVWLLPLALPVGWSPLPGVNEVTLFGPTSQEPSDLASVAAPSAPAAVNQNSNVARPIAQSDVAKEHAQGVDPYAVVLGVWLSVGGVLVALRIINTAIHNRRVLRASLPADPRLADAMRQVAAAQKWPPLPIVISSAATSPALFGIRCPRILFPPHLADRLSDAELRWVLLHELAHYMRKDLWSLSLLQWAAALHWFNPLAWLALRLGRIDTEVACDELVLRRSAQAAPEDYGAALLKVLGSQPPAAFVAASLGIVEDKRQLASRLTSIMDFRRLGLLRAASSVAALGALAVVGFTQEQTPRKPETSVEATAATPLRATPTIPRSSDFEASRAKAIAWEENVKLDLRAVGEVGGVPVAVVDIEGSPVVVTVSSGIHALSVEPFDSHATQLVVRTRTGKERVLKLEDPRPIEFPDVRSAPLLTPEAVQRRYEVVRHSSVPAAIVLSWKKLDRAGKEVILMNYLRTGEVIQIFDSPGGISTTSGFLFSEQLQAIKRGQRDRFLASLTPEQREKFGSGGAAAVRFTESQVEIQKQLARAKEAAARRDEVLATLSPVQRQLYEEWMGQSPK